MNINTNPITTSPLRRGFVLIALALAAVALSPTAWAEPHQCSQDTLNGAYMSNQAGFLNGLPIAQVNHLVADGMGGATGSGTVVVNGVPTVIPLITATYSINADCTGTLASVPPGLSQNFVIKNDGSQIFFIVTAHPAGAATMSGEAVRLSKK